MSPIVYYRAIAIETPIEKNVISFEQEKFLQDHFALVDATGNLLEGYAAILYWCTRQNLPVLKTISEFIETRKKYLSFINKHYLIDGLAKNNNTKGIHIVGVDQLYYIDFYAIERFGKTRLGTLMHYAKQGQNRILMKQIVYEVQQRVLKFVHDEQIDAIVYVPPTIKRQLQIMDYLKKHLKIDLPVIKVEKIKSPIIVPQKALSKIFERVANAKNSFVVPKQLNYNHVLIIDDAIGSGATINEIAIKIKNNKMATRITGLAITGSYTGIK